MSLNSIWKYALAALVSTAVLVPAAQAADLGGRPKSYKDDADYGPPRYLWTGLYTGLTAGYGWGTGRLVNPFGDSGNFDTDGFIGGGTLGYNFQSGQIVWGLEADISYLDVSGTSTLPPDCVPGACTSSLDWLGTVRARVGLDLNGWMPYITGGFAFGDASSAVVGQTSASDTLTGWTAGGGLEVKMDRNWSFKAEYLFVDLGHITLPNAGTPIQSNFDELHIVRAGINYKF